MSATVTLTITLPADVTASAVKNTVRRAFEKNDLVGDQGEVAGIRYQIKHSKTTHGERIRTWAASNGFETGARGRFSHALVEAYNTANPEDTYVQAEPVQVKAPKAKKSAAKPSEAATIRLWARETGVPVGQRGRIHPEVKAAYAAAHTA